MSTQAAQEMALRFSSLLETLEGRIAHLASRMEDSTLGMEQSSHVVGRQAQQLAHNAAAVIRSEGREAIESGAREGLAAPLKELRQAIAPLQASTQELGALLRATQRQQMGMFWLASVALVLASLLAAGGSSYLLWKNQKALRRAEFARDLLDATRSGTIHRCDGRLCVRVGNKPEQYSKNPEYIIVR